MPAGVVTGSLRITRNRRIAPLVPLTLHGKKAEALPLFMFRKKVNNLVQTFCELIG